MGRTIFLLALVFGTFTLNAQELNGVWLSTDTQVKNLPTTGMKIGEGTIIDFENNRIGAMTTIEHQPIKLNRKKTKIKATGIKGKLKVQTIDQNLLVLKASKGVMYAFKKLDLTHKIDMERNELTDFLINQHCDLIQNIQGQFTAERFFKDKPIQNRYKKNQFINFTTRDNGYWYFRKIKGNAFLVLTTGQNEPENIFQVESLQIKGFNLLQLQNDGKLKNLTTLKTCL